MRYQRYLRNPLNPPTEAILLRVDRGEEIVEQILETARQLKISLASVEAIGATDFFTVGGYNVEKKEYRANEFSGPHEIVSLSGTITTQNGAPYCHLHLAAAGEDGRMVGGHLNRARCGATCEVVIRPIYGRLKRVSDEETGLNLWDL